MRWSGSFVLIHKAGIRAEKGRSVFVIEELRKKAGAGETAVGAFAGVVSVPRSELKQ